LALGGGTTGTITLQAPASVTGTGTYTLPDAYPGAASGYYLTSNLSGTLSWVAVAGGGDVVGPASAADGNFAVFGATGQIIAEPTTASFNNTTGRATFNGGVNIGVASSAQGTLVFANSANAFTTTIQQGSSSTASASYTWPLAPGTVNQILQTDGSGNLSWTAAGTGDMTTTTNQTVTGIKTFGSVGNVGKLAIAGTTSGSITLAAPATSSGTVTFPNGTQTIAGLATAQSFTQLQTFTNGLTVSGGTTTITSATTINFAGGATTPNLTMNVGVGTHNFIQFIGGTLTIPTQPTRSAGTKIVLFSNVSALNLDYAFGVSSGGEMWSTTASSFGWYCNTLTKALTLTNTDATLNGNFRLNTAGNRLYIRTGGTTASMGTVTLVAGTATVTHTTVTANTRIFLTAQTTGGTPGALRISAQTASTSFVISSSSLTDTSVVAWLLIEPL
jgi:hypothetical protein